MLVYRKDCDHFAFFDITNQRQCNRNSSIINYDAIYSTSLEDHKELHAKEAADHIHIQSPNERCITGMSKTTTA